MFGFFKWEQGVHNDCVFLFQDVVDIFGFFLRHSNSAFNLGCLVFFFCWFGFSSLLIYPRYVYISLLILLLFFSYPILIVTFFFICYDFVFRVIHIEAYILATVSSSINICSSFFFHQLLGRPYPDILRFSIVVNICYTSFFLEDSFIVILQKRVE